jgi:hypothetical protein
VEADKAKSAAPAQLAAPAAPPATAPPDAGVAAPANTVERDAGAPIEPK